jgi:DNA-binding NarL/FixJ family response regulator
MTKTKIALFDDNKNLRESIVFLLGTEENLELVGLFPHVNNCIADIEKCNPDLILMDIEMPGLKGTEAVRLIKTRFPDIRIIMQTVVEDDDKIFDSICAGATSYILKNRINTDLIAAINDVIQGGSAMSPSIAKKVLKKLQSINPSSEVPNDNAYQLSTREKDVLACIVNGQSHKMIGTELSISYETVRSHVKNIYRKLQVASLTETVNKVINEKLL